MAEVQINARLDPKNTDQQLSCLEELKAIAISCVLSPNSAKKTTVKLTNKVFQPIIEAFYINLSYLFSNDSVALKLTTNIFALSTAEIKFVALFKCGFFDSILRIVHS